MKVGERRYIGDGAYVEWDGVGIILTTSNGFSVTNSVYLEEEVLREFERFFEDVKAHVRGRLRDDGDRNRRDGESKVATSYTEEDGDNASPDRWRR